MTESIIGLLSALLGFAPATGSAQREPVALLCREVKPEPADEADRRFFVHLDFDEKVIRFHRRDLPMAKMLMIQNWRVEFADDQKSPTLLGTINRITGDISIDRVGSSDEKRTNEVLRASCERIAPIF
jgi:hypothetical protein